MRSILLIAAAVLGLAGCSRDLVLPDESPPRVDAVGVVGLESRAVTAGLPVMGGELVALLGSGFPATSEAVQVSVSGQSAEVVSISPGRIVIRFPVLGAAGLADVTVSSATGLRTLAGAFRYDGPGQPQGTSLSDVQTAIGLHGVVPVEPPPAASGFADLAVAFGSGDSALLVVPALGVAATTIPLGLLPASAAARVVADGANFRVEVLALDVKGTVGLGQATLSPQGVVLDRQNQRALTSAIVPRQCESPRVLFTRTGTPVGAWVRSSNGVPVIATIDLGPTGTEYRPLGGVTRDTADRITGWAAWKSSQVVFSAGDDVYLYDAGTQAAPAPLQAGGQAVKARLQAGCGPGTVEAVHSVAVANSQGSEALAIGYRAGGVERVALVDLLTGVVRRGLTGLPATSLTLAPVTPFVSISGLTGWHVLAAAGGDLLRLEPQAAPSPTCGEDLVPDASLELSPNAFASLPGFAGMATFASGTRVLSTTPAGDLVTVLPPTLTSPGAVFRFASYGKVAMTIAPVDVFGTTLLVPLAVAEHTWVAAGASSLDTGSAQLVLALDAGDRPLALGGSAFGRGSVWVKNPSSGQSWDGALAYTGDVPRNPDAALPAGKLAGGSSAITSFKMDTLCTVDPQLQIVGSAPLAGNPDLVAQGPARAGQFGLDGITRHGPASAPTYLVSGTELQVLSASSSDACLAPTGGLDTGACTGTAIELGVSPLDVTLSSGDVTAAVRSLDACVPCTAPFSCTGAGAGAACAPGDILCQRAFCGVASALRLVTAAGAPRDVALPSAPAGVAADRAGGFLLTLPCTVGGQGFDPPFDALCPRLASEVDGVGALAYVPEGAGSPTYLAVGQGLAGAVAITPNGAEVWVTGPDRTGHLLLRRFRLPRSAADGRLDLSRRVVAAGDVLSLGTAGLAPGGFAASGITFSPEGSVALATVPADFRILRLE
jgi:hypothetical protein